MRTCNLLLVLALLLGLAVYSFQTSEVSGEPQVRTTSEVWAATGETRPARPATIQTRTFRQGLDGYAGVRDTWVSTLDWDTPPQHTVNYGQNEGLELSRNDDDNPLIRFDLTAIPTNSAVMTATLWLYNTTRSSYSGTQDFARRVRLFRVLTGWDEGNQVASPIDAAGKHGATGDNAFDYYPGQGTDVPWGAQGMAAGVDYAAAPESYADVVNEGWYAWDTTALVRAWVRGEQPNYGLVLRDATGYQDDHRDWRTFCSSQSATANRRPRLVVAYNPDVPYAHAGPDQTNLAWDGSAITLDGSASRDRPGGDDAALVYEWRVAQPAYGSPLSPLSLLWRGAGGEGQIISFTPDVPGEWDIVLTVTNNISETASDTVHLRLLSISAAHPRIYLTPVRLADLQARAVPSNTRWTQLKAEADDPDGPMHAHALVYQVTGQTVYADRAIAAAEALMAEPYDYATKSGDLALVYDWCYPRLSTAQRAAFVAYFNTWGDAEHSNDSPGWGNYWPRYGYSYALVGLATAGDNPRAPEWLDEFRYTRYRDVDLALLDRIAQGGAWPEGMIYDWIANWPRVKALDAWRTATGEDLFQSTAWYQERLPYLLLHRWPGVAEQWGYQYHPYLSTGDTERNRGSIANYGRIMALILVGRFQDDPWAAQLQAYLAAPPTANSDDFLYHEEFLWFDPALPTATSNLLTQYARGTGTVFMRSGWPAGAADTDTSATYVTFQCGDHFTYHQHYDQNSFTLFKRGDLLLDSGVYSGDGLSDHDINYYVRTIAHNTLVVYNPAEDFSSARPDAYSNDGGQRTMTPASRSPENIEYFDQHAVHYDTGDILRFQDDAGYTYVLGDAAKAYNNPTYNQAMDTGLDGNTAKVSRFQREFVYLRPPTAADGPPGDEFVVLYDRVGVTDPALSGENTKLLFHTLNQPTVNGAVTVVSPGETLYAGASEASAISGDGRVFLRFLLPATRNVRRVGGRGEKAFWVFNDNYDWQWDPGEAQPRPTNDFEDVPYGEWRLELEPADAALEHGFLTVIYPAVSTTFATHSVLRMPATTLITGAGLAGAHIADPALNRVVLFSSASDGSAPPGALVYAYQPTTSTLNLLVDLTPGARYALTTTTAGGVQTVTWTPDSGGAYQASDQGALSMVLDVGGAPLDQHRLYLPLVLRGLAVDVVAAPATGEMIPRAYLPLVSKPLAFAGVNDFLYQLQNLNLTAIGNTAYDLVVMDYSADGSAGGEFSAAQIAALKHSPGGDKIVLAYMSIGEAEDYRFYWQSGWTPGDPAWLDVQNPDWPGNYKVRYWDPGWQAIVFSYTDRLLDAGFDGAYLDIIDAYEYYADRGRATAAQEMADFVAAIRAYARARDPDFLIVPQNAPELAGLVPAYLHSVDGIGQEDIYYGYNADNQPTPPAVTAEMEGYLDVFKAAGKLVLTVDYATTPAHVDDAYAKSQAKGYVPFVTVRDLDQLTINPGHEPD